MEFGDTIMYVSLNVNWTSDANRHGEVAIGMDHGSMVATKIQILASDARLNIEIEQTMLLGYTYRFGA